MKEFITVRGDEALERVPNNKEDYVILSPVSDGALQLDHGRPREFFPRQRHQYCLPVASQLLYFFFRVAS
jgi:hypothetical protein